MRKIQNVGSVVKPYLAREGEMIRLAAAQAEAPPEKAAMDTVTPDKPAQPPPNLHITRASSQPTTTDGIQFNVSVKVDMAEIAGWSPDRITAFFGGIAQVLAAKGALEKSSAAGQ